MRDATVVLVAVLLMLWAGAALWTRERPLAAGRIEPAATGFKIDLNTADAKTLAVLPNVGPARAAKIVEYRESRGGRAITVDELDSVEGIGARTLEQLRPYLIGASGAASQPMNP